MGTPMACNLVKAGFDVMAWNRTQARAKPLLDQGVRWAGTAGELARHCEVVITMVTNGRAVKSVICDKEGVLEHAKPGQTVIIDMSSIPPDVSRSIADRAKLGGWKCWTRP